MKELYAVMSREVAHYVLDHAIITVNKNIARAKRAQFWGAVADGVVAATEEYLYDRYDYYVPGLVFATNDVVQALVNDNIANRMGLFGKTRERSRPYSHELYGADEKEQGCNGFRFE